MHPTLRPNCPLKSTHEVTANRVAIETNSHDYFRIRHASQCHLLQFPVLFVLDYGRRPQLIFNTFII